MNINFHYYCNTDDIPKPVWFCVNIYDDFTSFSKYCPDFTSAVRYLMTEELVIMDVICKEFKSKYDLTIKFHTQYFLEDGISNPKRSLERKKDKTDILDNRLSFSITSKSQSILIPMYSKDSFIHIPNNLRLRVDKPLPIKIINIDSMNLMLDEKNFPNKKPSFKELTALVEELDFLNSKLEDFKKSKRPLLIETLFRS